MTATLPEHPMVQYLNSLRTQEEGANPSYVEENRRAFLDSLRADAPWFPSDDDLRIPTRLDRLVEAMATDDLPLDLVFLTGDAGDGKTAVCAMAAARLGHPSDLMDVTTIGPWTIVKDASEIEESRLEDLIEQHLRGRREGRKLLVAINEGRLRRLVQRPRGADGEHGTTGELARLWDTLIEPSLAAWIDAEQAVQLDKVMREARVAFVNFRHRMHVRDAVPRLLARWTARAHWEETPACGACPAKERCPILANAADLRDTTTQTRIADVLASAHFAGHRLPFRRLQAVLAITCTGGLRCKDVHTGALAAEDVASVDVLPYRFYESLFYRTATRPIQVRQEPVSRAFAPADAGAVANFDVDQEVAGLVSAAAAGAGALACRGRPLPPLECTAVLELRARLSAPTPNASPLSDDLGRLTRSIRRWASLTSESSPPWRRSLGLLESYARRDEGEPLRGRVVGALNKLHRVAARNEQQLVSRQLDPASFRNPSRLALELDLGTEFEAKLRKGPVLPALVSEWIEGCPSEIELEAFVAGGDARARLRLDARLVEVLDAADEGYVLLTGLGPYRRDLARFHAHLVSIASTVKEPRLLLRVGEKVYRLAPTPGKQQLRFEGQS